jgi:hypothetical protein
MLRIKGISKAIPVELHLVEPVLAFWELLNLASIHRLDKLEPFR